MLQPDELACARSMVESGFQDDVSLVGSVFVTDDQNNRVPGEPVTVWQGKGTLKRMSPGTERQVADRLQGSEGYLLKIPNDVPPLEEKDDSEGYPAFYTDHYGEGVRVEGVTAKVNGSPFEIVAAFVGEARATHARLYLKRLS